MTIALTEQEILAEGILDSLKAGIEGVKTYATHMRSVVSTHKQLKSLDGFKTFTNETLKDETIRLRKHLILSLSDASPKIQSATAKIILRLKASPLTGIYVGRNYYHDFIIYTMIKPLIDMSITTVAKFSMDRVVDRIFGFLLVTITGIPSLADVKDAAEMAKSLATATANFARKIDSLKPADIAECFSMSLMQELRRI